MSKLLSHSHGINVGRFGIFFGTLMLLLVLIVSLHLAVNVTPSMPMGLYRLHQVNRPIVRGDIVQVCAPAQVAKLGAERGLLPFGPCKYQTAALLKFVAAISGDTVDLSEKAVVVNGVALSGSRRLSVDRAGRSVPHIPDGRYVLKQGEVWLWSPYPRSWDSRYFGPVASEDVRGLARIVLVNGSLDTWEAGLQRLRSIPPMESGNSVMPSHEGKKVSAR